MLLDILMTLFSIILMGGNILFPDDRIHQIMGMSLLALWVVHVILNRRWFASLFKGKYQLLRRVCVYHPRGVEIHVRAAAIFLF